MNRKQATTQQLLVIQGQAAAAGDTNLLRLAWLGLGYHRSVSCVRATDAERTSAREELAL